MNSPRRCSVSHGCIPMVALACAGMLSAPVCAGPARHFATPVATEPAVVADFGTAAGTNRLAKIAIRLPDIRGVRLGMPASAAEAALKAALPGATVAREYFGLRPLPGRKLSGTMTARTTTRMVNGEDHDEIYTVVLTSYPSEVVAASIRRSVTYTSQEAPSVANTVAALQHKYGPATVSRPDIGTPRLSWIFDAQGQFVTPARYEQLHHKGADCADIDHANPRNILLSAGGSDPRLGCTPWTTLTVRLNVQRLAPQNAPWPKSWAGYAGYVVRGMMIDFVDNLLAHSSAEALRTAAIDVEKTKARKANVRASGNTPTF